MYRLQGKSNVMYDDVSKFLWKKKMFASTISLNRTSWKLELDFIELSIQLPCLFEHTKYSPRNYLLLILFCDMIIQICLHYSSKIQTTMLAGEVTQAVEDFCHMTSLYQSLQSTHCQHLRKFAHDTIIFWYKILKDKVAR